MTHGDIRDLLSNLLSYDLDNILGEAPTNAQLTTQLNRAYREIAEKTRSLYTFEQPVTLVAGRANYDLRNAAFSQLPFYKIHTVTINNVPLRTAGGRSFGLWSVREFELAYPYSRTTASGTPFIAMALPHNTLRLFPAPSADVIAAGNNFLSGWYIHRDCVNETDDDVAPDLPMELHEVAAYYAADIACEGVITEPEQMARRDMYRNRWQEAVVDYRKRNDSLFDGGRTTRGSDWAEWISA